METNTAIAMFLRRCESKGLSPRTIKWYRGILAVFNRNFTELPQKPDGIELFLSTLTAGDERRHGYFRALHVFYGFLAKRVNTDNPMPLIDQPMRRPKQPNILMPDELNALLNADLPPKIKACIFFLVDTGARLGELLGLKINDLNETPWGFSARITGKTGTRTVPISYETYHNMMINLPIHYRIDWLGRQLSLAIRSAGLQGTAHTLRHTFGTLWEGDEIVLQQIMGHSTLEMTQRYRHLRMEVLSKQHRQFSPLRMALSALKNML